MLISSYLVKKRNKKENKLKIQKIMNNLIDITETTINNSKTISEVANFFNTDISEVESIISEQGHAGELELEDGLNYVVLKIIDASGNLPDWKVEVLHLDFFS